MEMVQGLTSSVSSCFALKCGVAFDTRKAWVLSGFYVSSLRFFSFSTQFGFYS